MSESGLIPVADRKLFNKGPSPVVFTSQAMSVEISSLLGEKASIKTIGPGPGGLSVTAAIEQLGELGAESVLIEGGGRLNYAALAEGIVDEIYLTIMPAVSGDKAGTSLADGPGLLGHPFLPLEMLSCEPVSSGELFLHFRVKKG